MKKSILLLLVLFTFSALNSQDKPDFENKIKEYITLSGGQKNFEVAVDQMIEMYKSDESLEVPVEFWDTFSREIKDESLDKLMTLLIPIYTKHTTEAEIDAGIAYFKTPLGKSLIDKQPEIMKESMQAGMIWGQELGMKIIEKMESMKKN